MPTWESDCLTRAGADDDRCSSRSPTGTTAPRTPFIGFNPNADLLAVPRGSHTYQRIAACRRPSACLMRGLPVKRFLHVLFAFSGRGQRARAQGLFFNGNDPLQPKNSVYGSSDFDRTHVLCA